MPNSVESLVRHSVDEEEMQRAVEAMRRRETDDSHIATVEVMWQELCRLKAKAANI